MTRIPVAVFMDVYLPGGTQRQMIELIARLDRRRFEVHAVCFHRGGEWDSRVAGLGVPVASFPIHGFRRPATARRLLEFVRWCRTHRIAVLQTCELYSNIFGLPGAALAGVPVRIGSRRGMVETGGLQHLQRLAYRTAHHVVANCEAAARQLAREGVTREKTLVIPNGIDLGRFPPRQRTGPVRRIAMLSVLREEKRGDVFVSAAARIAAERPDVEFIIAGEGPCRQPLIDQARQLGVLDRFDFPGYRDDVPQVLAEVDAFVLPSRTEAFPNAVQEAMAAGLPVVASAVGGIVELVRDGRTGYLVPPGDPNALAMALLDLIDKPERAAAFGAAARREVEERYSFQRMVARFEELYLTKLAGTRRHPDVAAAAA